MINELFILGNIWLLIAALPLIYRAWRDRNTLRGYSTVGSALTLAGLLTFDGAYVFMGNWWAIIINLPTVAYWTVACVYSRET